MAQPVYFEVIKPKADAAVEAKEPVEGETADAEAAKQTEPARINDLAALWLKQPKDCTDEEYKDFYKRVFHVYDEPLFYVHLNVDYPFNLKGILYFPKLTNDFGNPRGRD